MRAFDDGCSLMNICLWQFSSNSPFLYLRTIQTIYHSLYHRTKGVESVSRTVQKRSNGHWPVICIASDEETCTEMAKTGSDALTGRKKKHDASNK